MEGDEHTLEFNLEEYLLVGISIHQLDDGTTFYWNNNSTSSKRLYSKKNDKEIVAELPDEKCDCLGAYGDGIFLRANSKIFKATIALPDKSTASYAAMFYNMFFPESERIEVSYVRDVLRDEIVNRNGLSSRAIGDKEYVYRVGDDPEKDWILVDAKEKNVLRDLKLSCIHRDRAVYISYKSSKIRPCVRELGKNAIAIEIFHSSSNHINIFANDSSPFIYLAQDTILHTLDTDSMQFLPDLQTNRVSIVSITGVQDRVTTAQCSWDFDNFISTAQLPRGYYKNVSIIDELKVNMQEMAKRTDEIERKLRDVCERNRELEMKDRQNEMIKEDLLDTIDELRKQSSIVPPDQTGLLNDGMTSISADTAVFAVPTDPVMTPPPPPPPHLPPSSISKSSPTTSLSAPAYTPVRPSTLPAGKNDLQPNFLDELRKRQEERKMKNAEAVREPYTNPATPSPNPISATLLTPSPVRRIPSPVAPKPSRIPMVNSPAKIASPTLQNIPIVPTGELDSQPEDTPNKIAREACRNSSEDDLPPPPPHVLAASPCNLAEGPFPLVAPHTLPPMPPPPPPPPSTSTSSSANLLEEIRRGRRLKKCQTTPNPRRNTVEEQLREQIVNRYPRDESDDEEEEPESDSWMNESVH